MPTREKSRKSWGNGFLRPGALALDGVLRHFAATNGG